MTMPLLSLSLPLLHRSRFSSIFHFDVVILTSASLLHKDCSGSFLHVAHSLISVCWLISSIQRPTSYPSFVKTFNYLTYQCLRGHFLRSLLSWSPLISLLRSVQVHISFVEAPIQLNHKNFTPQTHYMYTGGHRQRNYTIVSYNVEDSPRNFTPCLLS